MADSGGSGDAYIIPLLIALLVAGPIILLIFIALAFSAHGPSASGASKPQYINPAPGSPDQPILQTFDRYVDPSDWLKKNGSSLTDISTQFQKQDAAMQDGVAYEGISGDNVTTMKATLKLMIADVIAIQAAKSGSQDQIDKTKQLFTDWTTYDNLTVTATASSIAEAGVALVNKNTGTTSIGYIESRPIIYDPNNLPKGLDSSGFIVYLLLQARVFHGTDQPTANTFYTKYATDTRFTLVDSAVGSRIDDSKVQSELQKGDIVLTSNGDISQDSSSTNINQAFMYIGPGQAGGDVIESTVTTTKAGPQFDTLSNHLSGGTLGATQQIQAILRLATPGDSSVSSGGSTDNSGDNGDGSDDGSDDGSGDISQ